MGVRLRVWYWPFAPHSISPSAFPPGDGDSSQARVHIRPAGTHVCPSLRPGFCSLATGPHLLPRGDTCARGARPAPPGAEHGLPHSSRSGSQHPPARAPQEPPRPGRCHLPQPSWCPSPPQPGCTRVGAADGSRPAGTHRALCRRRRRSRLPAAPRARLHLNAGARPLGAARAPPPVLGPLAASGSLSWPPRPLRPAGHSPAPSPHPRSQRVFPACPASRPCMGRGPGTTPVGPGDGKVRWDEVS
ncbi:proapoptotic nucleolar protein 1 [Mesoplodon densirostris]|uniref:proapoptotic nucleolar protein 1 n=1 Tax=Mesoplodon densirostris TaxID=48708 RepID=UPI0028DB7323|nr:proapoptotic nucleolar protein 1 [Mesoplodon densirostris]